MSQPNKVNGLTLSQRERMCLGKVRYSDENAAIAGGVISLERHGEENGVTKLYRYRCDSCNGWHLTRKRHYDQVPITINLDQFSVSV